ncbi:MAG: hypothetical protein NZ920_04025 [Aigarchaeota archaeon]|nr:hypothetical protein [Aigarchaeota archaeon]MDW8092211.1 hypothetical protein [Nitrososphaerota archaeon]
MSGSSEELESKIGQLIYTHVILERLRSFVLEKSASVPQSTFRLSLGRDNEGNEVFLNITVTRVKPDLMAAERRTDLLRKHVVLELVHDGPSEIDVDVGREFAHIIEESLKWWHGYLKERDRLRLREWRIVRSIAVECTSSRPVFTIPVEAIKLPEGVSVDQVSDFAEYIEQIADLFGPIYVKESGKGSYELVVGLPKLLSFKRMNRTSIDAYILEEGEGIAHIHKLDESFRRLLEVLKGESQ